MDVDYGEVIHKFYAGRQYGVRGPRYEDITWLEDTPKPSAEELLVLWNQIKDEVAIKRTHQQRATPGNYPSRDDMIVALWEMVVENRPETAQALQARRVQIKKQFPKPTT
jgi:hypothetical protein